MRKQHLLYIVFALVVVGLIGIMPVAAAGEEQIAFSAQPRVDDPASIPGYYYPGDRIHVMAPDGSGLEYFGGDVYRDWVPITPSWSPDCSKIAVNMQDRNAWDAQIAVMNVDETERSFLTEGGGQTDPAWSPVGSLIAYADASWREQPPTFGPPTGGFDICVMNPDGTGQTRLTDLPGSHEEPAWSPDGSKIAFASDQDGNYEIYIMDADGSNPIRVTNNAATDRSPAWSTQGQIAFVSNRDGNKEIYVINPDGTGEARLTDNPDDDFDPAWSPDGSQIVFVRGPPPTEYGTELYIMDKYGGQQTLLTPGVAMIFVMSPTWGPVSVTTPAGMIDDLATRVESYGIRAGIETGLTDKLDTAIAGLNAGNEKMAINNLNAFIRLVKAQRGKGLTPECADTLIADARTLIANLRL